MMKESLQRHREHRFSENHAHRQKITAWSIQKQNFKECRISLIVKGVVRSEIPYRIFEIDYRSSNARHIFLYMVNCRNTSNLLFLGIQRTFPSQKGLRHLFPACFSDELYVVFLLSYTKWKAEEEKESRWTKYQVIKTPYGRVLLHVITFNIWNVTLKFLRAKTTNME